MNIANAVNVPVDRVFVSSILAASTLVTFAFSPEYSDEGPSIYELLNHYDGMITDGTLQNHVSDLISSVSGPTIEVNVQNISAHINPEDRFVMPAFIRSKVGFVYASWELLCTECTLCKNCTLVNATIVKMARTALAASIHEPNTLQMPLVLPPHSLPGGSQYTFTLSASKSGIKYSDSVTVHVNAGPVDGDIQISPRIGQAITTTFHLSATGWHDEDTPLQYRYVMQTSPGKYIWLSERTANNNGSTVLSNSLGSNQDIILAVIVFDYLGAETVESAPVVVQPYALGAGGNLSMVHFYMARVNSMYSVQQMVQALSARISTRDADTLETARLARAELIDNLAVVSRCVDQPHTFAVAGPVGLAAACSAAEAALAAAPAAVVLGGLCKEAMNGTYMLQPDVHDGKPRWTQKETGGGQLYWSESGGGASYTSRFRATIRQRWCIDTDQDDSEYSAYIDSATPMPPSSSGICRETAGMSVPEDKMACAAVTGPPSPPHVSTAAVCEAVMTSSVSTPEAPAPPPTNACTYTVQLIDRAGRLVNDQLGGWKEFCDDEWDSGAVVLKAIDMATAVATISAETKTSTLMTLHVVTDSFEQLNDIAIDSSIALVDSLLTTPSGAGGTGKTLLKIEDLHLVVDIISNLIRASKTLFTGKGTAGLSDARHRSESVQNHVDIVSQMLAQYLVAGEQPGVLQSDGMLIEVAKGDRSIFEGSDLGSGDVFIPPNFFKLYNGTIHSQVVHWNGWIDLGPYFWATLGPDLNSTEYIDSSPEQKAYSKVILASGLLTVSFFDGLFSKIGTQNLDAPVQLGYTLNEGAYRLAMRKPKTTVPYCVHWNRSSGGWVDDGVAELNISTNASAFRLSCRFSHLTDFASFIGPAPFFERIVIVEPFLFLHSNRVGLALSIFFILIMCFVTLLGCTRYRTMAHKARQTDGRERENYDKAASSFVQQQLILDDDDVPWTTKSIIKLRTGCLLSASTCPLEGDPFLVSQRVFMIFGQILLNMILSCIFYSEQTKEECIRTCREDDYRNVYEGDYSDNSGSWSPGCDDECVEDLENSLHASLISAGLAIPVVGIARGCFGWLRRPVDRDLMTKSGETLDYIEKQERKQLEAEGKRLMNAYEVAQKVALKPDTTTNESRPWSSLKQKKLTISETTDTAILETHQPPSAWRTSSNSRRCCCVRCCRCVFIETPARCNHGLVVQLRCVCGTVAATLACFKKSIRSICCRSSAHVQVYSPRIHVVAPPQTRGRVGKRREDVAREMETCKESVALLFAEYDQNNLGYLEPEQVRSLMSELNSNVSVSDDALDFVLQQAVSSDGEHVEVPGTSTLKRQVRAQTRGLERAFKAFDMDGSGSLDVDELRQVLQRFDIVIPEKQSQQLLEKIDLDDDGEISYGEFLDFFSKDQRVSAEDLAPAVSLWRFVQHEQAFIQQRFDTFFSGAVHQWDGESYSESPDHQRPATSGQALRVNLDQANLSQRPSTVGVWGGSSEEQTN
jgi:Ca2+-binding EF-hand superfamily protein